MKKYMFIILSAMIWSSADAQGYEGSLRVEYKDESGKANNADVFIKGDKYYIRRAAGGLDKYSAYILDNKTHNLTCLSDRNPKTAVTFNVDKVLELYEKNKFKPGYKVHETQPYKALTGSKKIGEVDATEKKASIDTIICDIYTADIKVNMQVLIPILRIAGFWNRLEDGANAIVQGKTTNTKTQKVATVSMTPVKMKPEDKLYEVPKDYQAVDINRFIAEQASSPKLADLVRGFAGF